MIVWGTSFGSHDAALTVIDTDKKEILFASHSERFSKIKDDPNLCQELIDHVVNLYGMPYKVYYYENPWKKKLRYIRSMQFGNIFEEMPSTTLSNFGIKSKIIYTDHHLSHAAAGYFTSNYDNAAILVVDSIGEFTTLSIWDAQGSNIRCKYKQNYPDSLGLFYSAMTAEAGLVPNKEEYIFMGMAAYGNASSHSSEIRSTFLDFDNKDKIIGLRHNLHRGATRLLSSTTSRSYDLAAATQLVYEEAFRKALEWAWHNISSTNLILMGGCALNCVANSKVQSWHPWKNVWIMPNPGDAGSSLGSAAAHMQSHVNWKGPYLGYNIVGKYPIEESIDELSNSGIVAVANGKAEFGPRALGNRSIFADPRIYDIKKQMNWIKKREQFRPFAAVIPDQLAHLYFDIPKYKSSPYMQYVYTCKNPELYPGISHIDNTSRIQTITHTQHPALYELLMKWYDKTSCPMLINTSLNIKNQPLVNDEQDASEFQKKYNIKVFGSK